MRQPAGERILLPIDEVLPEILGALREHASLVLRAPTGAGKTTRVPPALLDAGLAGERRVVMLEPRRVAARAAARRMASERCGELGDEVGYQIRFERCAGPRTRILVVTEGILVRMLQDDPFLEAFGIVVFDEFHERNLHSDLSLAMARRVQREVRADLKLVVMSATLDPQPLGSYLDECAVVESAGRLHPVAIRYLEKPDSRELPAIAAAAVLRLLPETPGDVLTFLPGVGEIHRTAELLEPLAAEQALRIMPLYGELPSARQDAVLAPSDRRKVVLATNVAETSITIDGISAVVDSGLARMLCFDPSCALDRLERRRISRGSAEQRAGRAGRQGPGLCLRLWTRHDDRTLPESETPEIRRVDLAGPVLQLLAWGETDLEKFEWFEAPEPTVLARALELLAALGAMDARGLTELGRSLARLPLHPRLGRLVVAGHRRGRTRRAALLAALLSERDLVRRGAGVSPREATTSSSSDLLDRLEALESFARTGYGETASGPIHGDRAQRVLRTGRELATLAERELGSSPAGAEDAEEALLRSLLSAYPDRVARRRRAGSPRAVMVGGRGVRLAETSSVREHELLLAIELDAGRRGAGGGRGEGLVRLASAVEPSWLPASECHTSEEVVFDDKRERVVGVRRTRYRDLALAEAETTPDADRAAAVLAAAAAEHPDRALALDRSEVASLLARIRSLAEWMPELALPPFDATQLRELLPTLCAGKRSFAQLRRAPLDRILRGMLDFAQLEALDREAPERLTVPSGSRIRLRYEPGKPPVVAVRIQELFGLRETPRVAAGRVPVVLHLLAPNMRPQQITQDLRSFWENTYPEVRSELRARYPRHAWPQNPWDEAPERRPRRRG